MPLSTHQRNLIIGMFKLTMAISSQRVDDASREFENILTTYEEQISTLTLRYNIDDTVSTISNCCSIPNNVYTYERTPSVTGSTGFKSCNNDVELVISEEVQSSQKNTVLASSLSNTILEKPVESVHKDSDHEDSVLNKAVLEESFEEEVVEEESVVQEESVVDEEADDEEVVDEEADDEEVVDEEVVDEEADELELVPVRIKKVTYWKDEKSGDIYEYLPGDECGEKVGTYVEGKAVFN